jgi:hypothetical protein
MKLVEENIRQRLLNISVGKDFSGYDPPKQATKVKIDKWGIKSKSFCMISRVKTALRVGENISKLFI